MLEAVALGLFSEIQRLGSGAVRGVTGTWNGYVDLRGTRAENEQLKQELRDARVALQQERALAQRSRGLQQLLELRYLTSSAFSRTERSVVEFPTMSSKPQRTLNTFLRDSASSLRDKCSTAFLTIIRRLSGFTGLVM